MTKRIIPLLAALAVTMSAGPAEMLGDKANMLTPDRFDMM